MTVQRGRSWVIAFAGGAVSITLTIAATVLLVLNGHAILETFNPHLIVVGTTFGAVGWLIADRLPDNRIGWVMLAGSLFFATAFVTGEYAWFAVHTRPGLLPGGVIAGWIETWVWVPGTGLLLTGLPILFPDGRLPSRRWRPVVGAVVLGTVVATVAQAIGFWPAGDVAVHLLGTASASELPGPIGVAASIGQLATFLGPLAATGAVVVRLRRSTGIERLQMRWFVYAMVVTSVAVPLDAAAAPLLGWRVQPSIVGVVLIPIALAVAILRYRLYDIDRIISRTIAYAAVTAVLVATFAGAILLFQALLDPLTGGNTVAVAVSTLIVAALFQPLRRRVQRVVDRRFNRSRYDAERIASEFADHLRDEVDLGTLHADLLAVVERSLQPTLAGVWLREQRDERT